MKGVYVMKTAEQYWQEALGIIMSEVNDVIYHTFIKPIIPLRYIGNLFICTLTMDYNAYKDMIKKKYSAKIDNALTQVFGRDMKFVIESDLKENEINNENNNTYKTLRVKENGLREDFLFSNFIVGPSNNIAHAAAVAVAENPGEDDTYNPLFLYGGVGLGKTHLMHAIGNHILQYNPDCNILYVSCEKFANELIESIQYKKQIEFREKYRKLDVLLIDDIQFLSGKEGSQEEFFHTFNTLIDSKKQIVMCSDRKPSEIKTLTDRLVARMSMGLIFDIKSPDFETRTAILEKKAENKNIVIPKEILQYIAYSITSNIREMEGALNKIIMFARFNNRIIDMELAEEVIKDTIKTSKSNITIDYIQQTTADFYKITVEELLSKRRTQPLTTYRHTAMYLCRKLLEDSLEVIGDKFGGRDHSTVMNGCDKISRLIEKNDEKAAEISALEKRITG